MSFLPRTLDTYRKSSLVALWVGTLLYGVFLVLFGICLYIFRGRKQSQNIVLVVTAFIMFALSTAHIIMTFLSTFYAVLNPERGLAPDHFALAAGHIYITNNIVADGIIVRVATTSSSSSIKFNLAALGLSVLYRMGFEEKDCHPPMHFASRNRRHANSSSRGVDGANLLALSLVTSIVATSLTAGRIMWISYQTKKHLGKQFAERYNMAFQVVVESGLMYSISLIIFLVVYIDGPGSDAGPSKTYPGQTQPITTFPFFFPASYILYVALAQIMGIVSTLIIVRVGLGVSAGDHGETVGTSGVSRSTGPHIRTPRIPPAVSVELSTFVISSGPTPMDRRRSIEQKHPDSVDDASSSV
ncbi:hypothetical protein PLEOSDRAFT_1102905 [Pleurotus ostreatus PC15]|uniref:Uncharacterized protein n=1 Tax=Pleurotus ostreatus (strain PC15) TaxID=1137138 RepID=A0A067NPF8_PLEO1|nr:hypothetical protein PLEOSDRAFT_1102905 [Pleurotus ostreatus PC15]